MNLLPGFSIFLDLCSIMAGGVELRAQSAELPPSIKLRTSPDIAGFRLAEAVGNAGRREIRVQKSVLIWGKLF
jgi:hypothetical protein